MEKGVELKLQDSRGDMALQLDQLNTLLTQGVKYYVVVSNTTEATVDIASRIHAKGGGAAFSNIQPSVEALKVSPNFYLASSPESVAGQIQAQILDDYFKANPDKMANGDPDAIDAIFLYGQLGHPAQVYRTNAVKAGLKAAGYKLNVVAEDTANWKPDEAQAKMDTWLTAFNGEFDVVIANNDGMVLGAVESLLTARYIDDPNDPSKDVDGDGTVLRVPVLGVDAIQVAVKSMEEKKLFATVLQDAVGQATTAFELAYMMATEGSATGKTAWGLKPLSAPIDESPANDAAIAGNKGIFVFNKKQYSDLNKRIELSRCSEDIRREIRVGRKEEILSSCDTFFFIIESGGLPSRQAWMEIVKFISVILDVLEEIGIADTTSGEMTLADQLYEIMSISRISSLKQSLIGFFDQVSSIMQDRRSSFSQKKIDEITRFLDVHFADSFISAESVAERFYISTSYLTRLFKQNHEMGFLEYLNKLKMEKAKELLKTSEMKNYEIAEAIGFRDPHYFSSSFKKYQGQTPREYKQGL